MTGLSEAVEQILAAQQKTKKPLAIVLAGGKHLRKARQRLLNRIGVNSLPHGYTRPGSMK